MSDLAEHVVRTPKGLGCKRVFLIISIVIASIMQLKHSDKHSRIPCMLFESLLKSRRSTIDRHRRRRSHASLYTLCVRPVVIGFFADLEVCKTTLLRLHQSDTPYNKPQWACRFSPIYSNGTGSVCKPPNAGQPYICSCMCTNSNYY